MLNFTGWSESGRSRTRTCITMPVLVAALAGAGLSEAADAEREASVYDKVWSYAEWFRNDANPVIQSFQFTGRFQLDHAVGDPHQGHHEEWNIRRFRLGAKARLFQEFTLHGEVDLNPQEPDPLYQRMTDMYLAWSRNQDLIVTLGKQSAPFTLEGSTSSKELLTVDRGNLANNLWFPNEYFPGVSLSGRPKQWRYWAGLYSSGAGDREFGEFNGGVFAVGTLGYDFARQFKVQQALLSLNYVRHETDSQSTWTRHLGNIGSLQFRFDTGRWGVHSEVAAGTGDLGQSDLWGAVLLPFYNLTEKLQVAGRYTYLHSAGENGLRLALYENQVVAGRGDEYHEVYLGVNYYLYRHRLKLQTGLSYADMQDRAKDGGKYSGWSWTTGLRIAW